MARALTNQDFRILAMTPAPQSTVASRGRFGAPKQGTNEFRHGGRKKTGVIDQEFTIDNTKYVDRAAKRRKLERQEAEFETLTTFDTQDFERKVLELAGDVEDQDFEINEKIIAQGLDMQRVVKEQMRLEREEKEKELKEREIRKAKELAEKVVPPIVQIAKSLFDGTKKKSNVSERFSPGKMFFQMNLKDETEIIPTTNVRTKSDNNALEIEVVRQEEALILQRACNVFVQNGSHEKRKKKLMKDKPIHFHAEWKPLMTPTGNTNETIDNLLTLFSKQTELSDENTKNNPFRSVFTEPLFPNGYSTETDQQLKSRFKQDIADIKQRFLEKMTSEKPLNEKASEKIETEETNQIAETESNDEFDDESLFPNAGEYVASDTANESTNKESFNQPENRDWAENLFPPEKENRNSQKIDQFKEPLRLIDDDLIVIQHAMKMKEERKKNAQRGDFYQESNYEEYFPGANTYYGNDDDDENEEKNVKRNKEALSKKSKKSQKGKISRQLNEIDQYNKKKDSTN